MYSQLYTVGDRQSAHTCMYTYTQSVIGICTHMRVHMMHSWSLTPLPASPQHCIQLAEFEVTCYTQLCKWPIDSIALHRFADCTCCKSPAVKPDKALSAASNQTGHAQGAHQTPRGLTSHHCKLPVAHTLHCTLRHGFGAPAPTQPLANVSQRLL